MVQADLISQIKLKASAVTIGGYDGIHCGHRFLLDAMLKDAHQQSLSTVMVTFDPLPFVFFQKPKFPKNIILPQERAEIAEQIGIDYLITLKFDQQLADQSASEFISELSDSLGLKSLWVGEDFSLGKNREGSQETLKKLADQFHFALHILPKLEMDGGIVSSTWIRGLITEGQVQEAAKLLGYPFFIENKIVHGAGRGKKLGFPTVNMQIPEGKIIPAIGVYATYIRLHGKKYPAITNVGTRPTFYSDHQIVLETFVFSSDGKDEYGETARVEFLEYMRPEFKFGSADELVNQIRQDIQHAEAFFEKRNQL